MTSAVYIESSVISYLTARTSRDVITAARQAITQEWWSEHLAAYEVFISAAVEEEISGGDSEAAHRRLEAIESIPSLQITPDAQNLAKELLAEGAIPANSPEDALHIGIAAANGIEFLVTWNFKHINNAHTRAVIVEVIERQGFLCPLLCSPEELGANV